MLIASPDVIFLTTRPLYEENDFVYTDCTYSWPESSTKVYQLCIVTLLFVGPFVLMSISYSHIVHVLWRNETMADCLEHSLQLEEELVSWRQRSAACEQTEEPSRQCNQLQGERQVTAREAAQPDRVRLLHPLRVAQSAKLQANEPRHLRKAERAANLAPNCRQAQRAEETAGRLIEASPPGSTGDKLAEGGQVQISARYSSKGPSGVSASRANQRDANPTVQFEASCSSGGAGCGPPKSGKFKQQRVGSLERTSCTECENGGIAGQVCKDPVTRGAEPRFDPANQLEPELNPNPNQTKTSTKTLASSGGQLGCQPNEANSKFGQPGALREQVGGSDGSANVGGLCAEGGNQGGVSAVGSPVKAAQGSRLARQLEAGEPMRAARGESGKMKINGAGVSESMDRIEIKSGPADGGARCPIMQMSFTSGRERRRAGGSPCRCCGRFLEALMLAAGGRQEQADETSKRYRRNLANFAAQRDKLREISRLTELRAQQRLPGAGASGGGGSHSQTGLERQTLADSSEGRSPETDPTAALRSLHSSSNGDDGALAASVEPTYFTPDHAASQRASSQSRFSKLIESRKKAAKMLIVIVIMFGLCYLPIHFLNILR